MKRMRESQTHSIDSMSNSTQHQRYLWQLMGALVLLVLIIGTSHAEFVNPSTSTNLSAFKKERICPTHIRGDREYSSNGPTVDIQAWLYIDKQTSTTLYLYAYMHQIETKSDWSEAERTASYWIYTAPPGRRIGYVWNTQPDGPNNPPIMSTQHYVDTDHAEDRFYPADALVKEFRAKGDTNGNDIGNCTWDDAYLSVFLEPLWVWLE
jgi:hypothetical protein